MDTLWRPRSAYGTGCLPGPEAMAHAGWVRRTCRLIAVLAVTAAGVFPLVTQPLLPRRYGSFVIRTWARGLLAALGVRLVVRGCPPHQAALLVANHISWLDTVAILAVTPARMLAKQEVRRWPLIGGLAVTAGTLFVDRSRPRSLPGTVQRVSAVLQAGGVVAVFPQGTTVCGAAGDGPARFGPPAADGPDRGRCDAGRDHSMPFRPAMFQAAIDASVPVVPLAVGYHVGPAGQPTSAAAFVGDESLWRSLRRVIGERKLIVSVTVAPAVRPEQAGDRRRLAQLAESTLTSAGASAPVTPAVLVLAA